MIRKPGLILTTILSLTAGALAVATSPRAAAQPDLSGAVFVWPSTGLVGGDTVHVLAAGITPGVSVGLVQCDTYVGESDEDCYPRAASTARPDGVVSTTLTLGDPVLKQMPEGNPQPVYCRADTCRIFLVWQDPAGNEQVKQSNRLQFRGSPATVAVTPAQQAYPTEAVQVTGTAYGAQGHRVLVYETACYNIIQGAGCQGQDRIRTTRVNSHGRFAIRYVVHQFLPDPNGPDDCNNDGPSMCEVTAVILTNGQPDDSFGVSSIGQPAAWLDFVTNGAASSG
jgi:Neocarzinostatin family